MNKTAEVTLDDVGRLHLPEWMRQRLGLRAGSRLVVERTDEAGAVLRAEVSEPSGLVEDRGLLYFDGEAVEDLSLFVSQERERHLEALLQGRAH